MALPIKREEKFILTVSNDKIMLEPLDSHETPNEQQANRSLRSERTLTWIDNVDVLSRNNNMSTVAVNIEQIQRMMSSTSTVESRFSIEAVDPCRNDTVISICDAKNVDDVLAIVNDKETIESSLKVQRVNEVRRAIPMSIREQVHNMTAPNIPSTTVKVNECTGRTSEIATTHASLKTTTTTGTLPKNMGAILEMTTTTTTTGTLPKKTGAIPKTTTTTTTTTGTLPKEAVYEHDYSGTPMEWSMGSYEDMETCMEPYKTVPEPTKRNVNRSGRGRGSIENIVRQRCPSTKVRNDDEDDDESDSSNVTDVQYQRPHVRGFNSRYERDGKPKFPYKRKTLEEIQAQNKDAMDRFNTVMKLVQRANGVEPVEPTNDGTNKLIKGVGSYARIYGLNARPKRYGAFVAYKRFYIDDEDAKLLMESIQNLRDPAALSLLAKLLERPFPPEEYKNTCFNCGRQGHKRGDCFEPPAPFRMCYNCGERNVTLRTCYRCSMWWIATGGRTHAKTRDPKYCLQQLLTYFIEAKDNN